MRSKLNVGLIGLGRLGRNYADYMSNRIPDANLIAIADINETFVKECGEEFEVTRCYGDYCDLLSNKEVDAAVITTPTGTHKNIIVEAAKQGKAVFCEKPLTLSLQEGLEIKQAVEQAGIFFHMGFMRRFDKGYAAAKRKVDDGLTGKPVVFKSTSRDPYRPSLEYADPKISGGIFADMGIHDFDLARWFMGEVKSVFSVGGVLAYPEMKKVGDIDNGITTIVFENGTLGVVDLTRNGVYGYDIATEILGTNGTLRIGYLRETPVFEMTKAGISHDVVPYFMERFEYAYVAQLQNFIQNLLEGSEPAITCMDGIEALKVSLAAKLSYDQNRSVEIKEVAK